MNERHQDYLANPNQSRSIRLSDILPPFPEAPGLQIGTSPLELVGRSQTEQGEVFLARAKPLSSDQTYAILTQLKNINLESQGKAGSVADWLNPVFRESHRKFNAGKWDSLLTHLDAFVEVIEQPGSSSAPWDVTARHLSSDMLYRYLMRNSQFGLRPWYRPGVTYPRAPGYEWSVTSTGVGSLIDTFHQFYKQNGYDYFVPEIARLERFYYLTPKSLTGDPDRVELFNDGRRKWETTLRQLYQLSVDVHSPLLKDFYSRQEKITREFFYTLGDDPAARAMQLVNLIYNNQKTPKLIKEVVTPLADNEQMTFRRVDDSLINVSNIHHDITFKLADDWRRWFHRPDEIVGKQIQPLLCWERFPNGDRSYLFDHTRVEELFPGITQRPDRDTIPDTLAGYLMWVYTQPDVYGQFPEALPLPPTYDETGRLISPKPNRDSTPKMQDMQEGQIPFLAMHWERRFLTDAALLNLENAFL